jgi:hypothetical protein
LDNATASAAAELAKIMNDYAALEKKYAQLRARAELHQARQSQQQRKRETRQKIIIGGAILTALRHDDEARAMLQSLLNRRITDVRDRDALRDVIAFETLVTK